jgi:hypothetical protein
MGKVAYHSHSTNREVEHAPTPQDGKVAAR